MTHYFCFAAAGDLPKNQLDKDWLKTLRIMCTTCAQRQTKTEHDGS